MNRQPDREVRVVTGWREIHAAVEKTRADGCSVGVVPTMGALHEGHLSLVRAAERKCDRTVVTIFVNPTQFGPGEDLGRYPRTLDADLALLGQLGVAWVFVPSEEEVYPGNFSTYVEPPAVARRLEGERRPGHFRGVATVVLKLLHMVPADVAFFGQKDYQQSLVIRRMVEDLNLAVDVQVCPTVREPDGLAMSSRNRYLNAADRERALALSRSLALAQSLVSAGQRNCDKIRNGMRELLQTAGVEKVDYVSLSDPNTLVELQTVTGPLMALVAAHVGTTRLIDNARIEPQ